METLDKFDIAILQQLQTDARLTNAELASRVGLSAAPCWRRVRALEEEGFITGYRAEINRQKIGLGVLAFVRVDADRNNGDSTRQLEQAIRDLPEVVACHYISGTGTFELQVVAQDLDAFSRFALQSLINLPNVKDLHTSFSLGEVKASSALPLGHLHQPVPATAPSRTRPRANRAMRPEARRRAAPSEPQSRTQCATSGSSG
ncbi:MAG: Lrp/AsnC family transcriptional regulator, partial [Burkholderiales bacterium]